MRDPDRPGGDVGERLSPRQRRRVMRAAVLRPMHLLMVVIGAVAFAFTLEWWLVPLTLATYAALVFLATRNPLFQGRILEGRETVLPQTQSRVYKDKDQNISPERRARRLPQGETRRKMEAALEAYRRTLFAIEESDDIARAALGDTIPKLDGIIERLLDIAQKREKATRETGIENDPRAADAEISEVVEKLSTFRTKIVRVSAESGSAVMEAATELNADLDALNLRLEALSSTMSPPE